MGKNGSSSDAPASNSMSIVLTFIFAFASGIVGGQFLGSSSASSGAKLGPTSSGTDSIEILRSLSNHTRFPCASSDRLGWEEYCDKINCHKDKYLKQIHSDLDIWRAGGIRKEMTDYTIDAFHVAFQIIDNELYILKKPNDDYLLEQWTKFLSDMLEHVTMPDVEFSLNTRDRPKALKHETTPVFSHVKTDAHSDILVIHPWQYDLFRDGGHHQSMFGTDLAVAKENVKLFKSGSTEIRSPHRKKWAERMSKAVWRGSPNGGDMREWNYIQHPRPRVADIGMAHPELIDAKFSEWHVTQMEEDCHHALCKRYFGSDDEKVYKPMMKKNYIPVHVQSGNYKYEHGRRRIV
jgi:hypothetical protein